jgi:hypothetical protein
MMKDATGGASFLLYTDKIIQESHEQNNYKKISCQGITQ